jgi:ankyrin repeat protein
MIAVEAGNVQIARRLPETGAEVSAHNASEIGHTALRTAASNGTLEMVEPLLSAGADPTPEGWMWITPLDKARERKRGDGPRICEALERAAKRFGK